MSKPTFPTKSTIFEGHFPGYPLMPGVLLLETMAQASGWLILGVNQFTGMPFLAAFKEAKFRSFVTPGTALQVNATLRARRLGLRGHPAPRSARTDRAMSLCNAEITFRLFRSRTSEFRDSLNGRRRHRVPDGADRPWLTRAARTWITGIGIVSCLGEGPDAHWQGLMARRRLPPDATTFAPYVVHRLAPLELDKQIPKKGDQRQMEPWQRIGTYAAGLALDIAGAKGNAELLGRMDMIVAAGGGERDEAVDADDPHGLGSARTARRSSTSG